MPGLLAWSKSLLPFVLSHGEAEAAVKNKTHEHPTSNALQHMVNHDGAGQWPPRAEHKGWPAPLQHYHDIYQELSPMLSTFQPSMDDETNRDRMRMFRTATKRLLQERVCINTVKIILDATAQGEWTGISRAQFNGFYGCIAMLRHAYRWGTNPVVKVAQDEKLVEFPQHLDLPWQYLRTHFGAEAPAGNVTSNFLCTFDSKGRQVYHINVGMPENVTRAEHQFGYIFVAVEKEAWPVYQLMAQSMQDFEASDVSSCLSKLEAISDMTRLVVKLFLDTLVENKISKADWMPYVQGFQGWGTGETIDGEYVEYDGLSGNQVLFFRAMDAFLGLESYLPEENLLRYIPRSQRDLCLSLRAHGLRDRAKERGLHRIEEQMVNIAKQLRVFRAAHRARATPYLTVPAPERYMMTAGKGVLEGKVSDDAGGVINFLQSFLIKRFTETV